MLKLEQVRGGYGRTMVLHGVTFQVAPGQMVALVGPNAAGKTTVVRALTGRLPTLQGRITWQGRDVTHLRPRERARLVAVVPQNGAWPAHFTVAQTVLLGRTPYLPWWGAPRPADVAAARQALDALGLTALADRPLARLSGGERQRVLIARALAQDTPVLVLDEPTTYLDWRVQLEVLALARQRARAGLAVLAVLHDLNLAVRFADAVVLLQHGRVVAFGPPDRVLTPERVAQVYGVTVERLVHRGRLYLIPQGPVPATPGRIAEGQPQVWPVAQGQAPVGR